MHDTIQKAYISNSPDVCRRVGLIVQDEISKTSVNEYTSSGLQQYKN